MFIEIVHTNGKRYRIPVAQAVITTDDGAPLAVAYETAGLIVYTDATKADFSASLQQLRIQPPQVKVYDV